MKDVYIYSNKKDYNSAKIETDNIYIYSKDADKSFKLESFKFINVNKGLKLLSREKEYYLNSLFASVIVYIKDSGKSDIMISVSEKDFYKLSGKELKLSNVVYE